MFQSTADLSTKQSKRILFISTYFAPEPTGVGKYNGEMIDFLAAQGYQCTVVVPYPYYPFWKVQEPYAKKAFWYQKEKKRVQNNASITIYRCPQYVPKNPTGGRRMIQDFTFFLSSSVKMLRLVFGKKYDCVIAVAPSFMVGFSALLYKKLRGSKFIYHVQDLQIDAARDLNMIKSKFVVNSLLKAERYILKNADTVSSISPGMIERIKGKGTKEVAYLPNWVNTQLYYPIENKEDLKEEFGFCVTDKVFLYSGAVGEKQGLEAVIHAAKELQAIPHIKFAIGGAGPYKEKLRQLATDLNVTNVVFLPIQPMEKLNRFLNMADVHLILQKGNAGDLVMPSKLTTILAVGGLAIVTAGQNTSLFNLIMEKQIGLLAEPDNPVSLLSTLKEAIGNKSGRIAENARAYAVEALSIDKIFTAFPGYL